MVANIATAADGRASIMYVGERPWHGLGTELAEPATAREAIVAAGLDYDVRLVELYTADGIPAGSRRGVLRTDTRKVIGVVGHRYAPVQNVESFGFFDAVVGAGQAVYHTAGALGLGERIWMLAKIPGELRVNGTDDLVERFLLLSNTHDGSGALRMFFTPVRVVCQNTLNVALAGGAQQGISIRHSGKIETKVDAAQRALGLAVRYYDDLADLVGRMSHVQVGVESLRRYFESVVPDKPKAEDNGHAQSVRNRLHELFEHGKGNDMPGVRGTLWAAVNAVTEYTDHERPTRAKSPEKAAESRLRASWFGVGAETKGRAWREAMALLPSAI